MWQIIINLFTHQCGNPIHELLNWSLGIALCIPGVGIAVRIVRAKLGW